MLCAKKLQPSAAMNLRPCRFYLFSGSVCFRVYFTFLHPLEPVGPQPASKTMRYWSSVKGEPFKQSFNIHKLEAHAGEQKSRMAVA